MGGHAGGALGKLHRVPDLSARLLSVRRRGAGAPRRGAASSPTQRSASAWRRTRRSTAWAARWSAPYFGPAGVEWVSVGDSPLFLLRRGEILLLNEDHSLAPEIDKLAAAGKMTWEDAKADPRRHFLRSALTGADIDLIDRSRRPLALEPGDVVILASDGIHTLSEPDILRVVNEHCRRRTRGRRRCAARGRRGRRRHLPGQHHGRGRARQRQLASSACRSREAWCAQARHLRSWRHPHAPA